MYSVIISPHACLNQGNNSYFCHNYGQDEHSYSSAPAVAFFAVFSVCFHMYFINKISDAIRFADGITTETVFCGKENRGTSWLRTKTGDEQGNRVEIPNGTAAVSAEAPSWHRPVIGKLRRRWRRRIISISVSQKTYEVCSWCARAVKRRMNSALQKCGCGNFRGRTPELPQFFMLRREKHNGTGTNRNGSS